MNVDERERSGFGERFKALTGHAPFEWQRRLFEKHFIKGDLPSALDLPTGLGKTSVMAIWYLARRAGAPVPRRLVYVVDRRAVVDQATVQAQILALFRTLQRAYQLGCLFITHNISVVEYIAHYVAVPLCQATGRLY